MFMAKRCHLNWLVSKLVRTFQFYTSGRMWLWGAELVMLLMRRCFPTFYICPVCRCGVLWWFGNWSSFGLIFWFRKWSMILLSVWMAVISSSFHFRIASLDRLFNRLRFIAKTCFVSTPIANEIWKHFCALLNNYCVYAWLLVRNSFKIIQQVWLSREHRLWDFPRAWNSVHRQNLSVRVIQPTLKQLGM
jgi:hypothetical protein